MSRALSVNFRRNANDPTTNVAFLALLTVRYSPTKTIYRVVNNNENVISRGMTFTAMAFDLQLPAESGEEMGVARLVIDNVDQTFTDLLREATIAPRVDIEIILTNSPDFVELVVFDLALRDVTWNSQTISGSLYNEDFLSQAYPGFFYLPPEWQGLFG